MDTTVQEPKPINVYIPPSTSCMQQPIKEVISPPLSCRYESQKKRDWNTFLQYLKNHNPPLELEESNSIHVIEFMKHLDQFGKTKTHLPECAYFGHPNPPAPCDCPLKQAWGSLDALMGRLRAAYEESGRNPELNPFGSNAVRAYLKEVRAEQAKARGVSYEKKRKRRSTTTSTTSTSMTQITQGVNGSCHGGAYTTSDAGGIVTSRLWTTQVFGDSSGSGSGSTSDAVGVITSVAGISQVVDSRSGGGGGGSVVSCSLPGKVVPAVVGITQVVDGSNGNRHNGGHSTSDAGRDTTSTIGIAQVVGCFGDGGYAAVASTNVINPVVDGSNGGGSGCGPISVATGVVTSMGGITQAVDCSSGSNGGGSVSDASGVAVFENIDTKHNQVDARINHAHLLHVRENENLANEMTSEKQKNERPTPESIKTELLLPCQKLEIGEVTEGSSTIIEHSERSKQNTPSSSEGMSPHPAPSFGQEKVGSVLDCNTFGSHQTGNEGSSIVRIEHSEKSMPTSLKPSEGLVHAPAANFGQENGRSVLDCKAVGNPQTVDEGSSSLTLEHSEKSIATTSNPSEGLAHLPAGNFDQENSGSVLNCNTFGSHQTTNEISLSVPSNGEGEKCDSLVLFSERNIDGQAPPDSIVASDERQCKRNGTRWRCHEKALPGRLHCEKHQTKRDNYNKLRRKNPERTRSTIDQCSPLIPRQCGRTGTGWRCPRMASLGKLYCDRHQPKRDAYNEKRRKKPKEDGCLELTTDNNKKPKGDGCLALTTDNNKTLAIQSSAEVQDGNQFSQ